MDHLWGKRPGRSGEVGRRKSKTGIARDYVLCLKDAFTVYCNSHLANHLLLSFQIYLTFTSHIPLYHI